MRNPKIVFPLLLTFLYSCASIVSPTGGPKDETPPICQKKVPADNTTNFRGSSIDFYFDEFIVLNDISNQFLISPPLEKNPDIKLKGKKVSVEFNEPLKPNTTYTLNFGNSIVDYNENNQLLGLSYTFSTGDYIDSLTLQGKIIDAYTLLPVKDVAVGLYEITEDSTIFKNKPYYLVRPDSSGNFKFNYLRPSEYELVAFEDINRNLKIEQNERLAFNTNKIKLSYEINDSDTYTLLLAPQKTDRTPAVITARELAKGKYEIITAGSKCNITITENGFNKKGNFITSIIGKNCDTVMVYAQDECKDSTVIDVQLDTVFEKVVISCNSKEYDKFRLTSKDNFMNYDFSAPLTLTFTNPVFEIREQEFLLIEDSIVKKDFTIDNSGDKPLSFSINYKWNEEKVYMIILKKGALKDVYGQENDSIGISIKTAAATAFGNLSINVTNNDSSQYIVQLLDNQNVVLKEEIISKTTVIHYKNQFPGYYFIKVIKDDNKNGRWDTGNYFNKQQPEKVFVTLQSLEVRANWDLTDIMIYPDF